MFPWKLIIGMRTVRSQTDGILKDLRISGTEIVYITFVHHLYLKENETSNLKQFTDN